MKLALKDIKPDVPIPSHHYFLYITIFIIILISLSLILYLRKKVKIKKEKELLFSLIDNPKQFAYEFKKAKKFINKKNETLYNEIEKRLKNYKYKKKVSSIDEETKKLIKQFLGTK